MPFLCLIGYVYIFAFSLMVITKKNFEICLPYVFFISIIISYIFGIMSKLYAAIWIMRIFAVLSVLVCIYSILIEKSFWKILKQNIPTMIVYFVYCAGAWWLTRGRMFCEWDEFSHWGLADKIMYYTDKLYTAPGSIDTFKSYPPASTLIQYVFLKIFKFNFREDISIFVLSIFILSLLIFPIGKISVTKKPIGFVVMSVLVVLTPIIIAEKPFYAITVDMLIGVLMAFSIVVAYLEEKNLGTVFLICGACFTLTLVKSTGFFLSLICCIIAIAFFIIKSTKDCSAKTNSLFYKILLYVLIPISIFSAKLSWNLHLQANNVVERWQTKNTFANVISFVFGTRQEYQSKVIEKFLNDIFKTPTYGGSLRFSPAFWFVIVFLIFILQMFFISKKEIKKSAISFVTVVFFSIVYILSLLYSYLFVFDEIEAVLLASLFRYLSAIFLMLVVFTVDVFCLTVINSKFYAAQLVPLFILLTVFRFSATTEFLNVLKNAPVYAAQTHHDRFLFRRTAEYIKQLGEENPKLYLISANDAGKTNIIVTYDLYPVQIPEEQNSIIGVNPPANQPWFVKYSCEEFSRLLNDKYDYLYILCPEDQFVRDYISIFEDESQVVVDRMFKVIKQPDGQAKLRRIDMKPIAPEDLS